LPGAIPAIASSEGRRIWGAIAPLQHLAISPSTANLQDRLAASSETSAEIATQAPLETVAVEAAPLPTLDELPASPNGTAPFIDDEETPFDDALPTPNGAPAARIAAPQPAIAAPPVAHGTNRRDDMFRREPLDSQDYEEEPPPQNFWQRLLAKAREIFGLDGP